MFITRAEWTRRIRETKSKIRSFEDMMSDVDRLIEKRTNSFFYKFYPGRKSVLEHLSGLKRIYLENIESLKGSLFETERQYEVWQDAMLKTLNEKDLRRSRSPSASETRMARSDDRTTPPCDTSSLTQAIAYGYLNHTTHSSYSPDSSDSCSDSSSSDSSSSSCDSSSSSDSGGSSSCD